MIKEIVSVLSQSSVDYDDLIQKVDKEEIQSLIDQKKKFRFIVEGLGFKIHGDKQKEIIEKFKCFPFDEKLVDLIEYDQSYKVIHNNEDNQIYFGYSVAASRPSVS